MTPTGKRQRAGERLSLARDLYDGVTRPGSDYWVDRLMAKDRAEAEYEIACRMEDMAEQVC